MKNLISRRHFLAALGAVAAAGALSGCGGQTAKTNANGERVFELTLSTAWPRTTRSTLP